MSRDYEALGYMILVVLLGSLLPLAIDFGASTGDPFLFAFAWHASTSVAVGSYVVGRYRTVFSRDSLTLIRQALTWRVVLWLGLGSLDMVFVLLAIQYVDIAVAAILFELGSIIYVVSVMVTSTETSRFPNGVSITAIYLAMVVVGIMLLLWSQAQVGSTALVLGGIFGVLAAASWGTQLLVAMNLSTRISEKLIGIGTTPKGEAELALVLIFNVVGTVAASPVALLLATNGLTDWELGLDSIAIGVIGGAFTLPVKILVRKANVLTDNLGINAIASLTPVLALGWLFGFARVDIERVDMLVVGALAVIVANLLISFRAEIRLGFQSLIVSLWMCGAFVYFRPDIAGSLSLADWLWPPGEYFTAVGLSATVFTLILSFRVARLVTRMADETNRAFSLVGRIDLLTSRGVLRDSVRAFVLRIDAPKNSRDLVDAYRSARLSIRQAYAGSRDDADRRELVEAGAELDALAHSRQEGQDFGEYVALVGFAVITVGLIMLSLDKGAAGWNGFLTEMFTVLFSAVILFLVVNVWDLQRERAGPVLKEEGDGSGYGVVFRDVAGRRSEQAVSVAVVLFVAAAFGWLLWEKWLQTDVCDVMPGLLVCVGAA